MGGFISFSWSPCLSFTFSFLGREPVNPHSTAVFISCRKQSVEQGLDEFHLCYLQEDTSFLAMKSVKELGLSAFPE